MPTRPNIIIILNDDMGFSDLGCYGGEVHTLNLDRLARDGLRLTQFYNTARCCPSRASLLTGLHPHQADVGHMMVDDGVDGYLGDLSQNAVTIAEVLRQAGYGTYMAGKWHVTRHFDGPQHNWPCQRGFDEFFGILSGACSFFHPNTLTRNNQPIDTPAGPFFLTDAISDEAADQIRRHVERQPDRPFFQYVAYTAPHWPLHAHPEDIVRYRGRFDRGWDILREERMERLVSAGILHSNWRLSPRDPTQPPWDEAPYKAWQARRMEVYAAQIDCMDQGIGRILAALHDTAQWDNTVVVFLSDNGGCEEEIIPDWEDWLMPHNAHPLTRDGRTVQFGNDPAVVPGGADTYQSYGRPWANLSNTPFREYKHWVHEGGIATPFIVHWPGGIRDAGALRHAPAQLPDIMATCLDLAQAAYPSTFNGQEILPLEGHSLLPLFQGQPFAREALFWEHEGNCGVRKGQWKLVKKYPGDWELYDMDTDRTELHDLSAQFPDRLEELLALYEDWADRCGVKPWDEILELKRARSSPDLQLLHYPPSRKLGASGKVVIERGANPYRDNVQGKANEPITVAALLDQAREAPGVPELDYSLEAIYDRLEANAPRIAIVGGSPDHPAHILDRPTALKAAARIWERGGVPFQFSIPVLCDGTAQSNIGMSYSLQSRNAVAAMVVNQMEAHSYHGAFVLSGCDKTPLGIVAGLAHLDRVRQARGDAPLFATFCPSHVLRGGTIPPDLTDELESVADRAEAAGHPEVGGDLRDTLAYILQCTSNEAFHGVLTRARELGVINLAEHKALERRLAVHTCHPDGGICAFNGTGNSSRNVVTALGLTHPAVELLTEPPTVEQVNRVVDDLFSFANRPPYSVSNLLVANFANTVRAHSATGGSTNLMMHMVAAMIYAGYDVDVGTIDAIRHGPPPVPDIFDYSLTQGRDIFALALQVHSGAIRGMETVFHELVRQRVSLDLDAPTVTGATWRHRMEDTKGLSAAGVPDNPIILTQPRRPFSGVDVLRGNFFESAVVKISGLTSQQLTEFDDQVCLVLFFENEEEANAGLLDPHLLDRLKVHPAVTRQKLLATAAHNQSAQGAEASVPEVLEGLEREALFDRLAQEGHLKLALVISGQGPEAFGMPEMFTPMQHINANRALRKLTVLLSDGRYSGVTYGAAIGHVTPEAFKGGAIGLLETGDLLHLQLATRRVDLIDPEAFAAGRMVRWDADLSELRRDLGAQRQERLRERQRQIAATNHLRDVTDASRGVVPLAVAEGATLTFGKTGPQSEPRA